MGMPSSQPTQCWICVPRVIIWSEGVSTDEGGTRKKADGTSTKSCGRFGPKLSSSRRHIRHRNPHPVARTLALFKRPRRLRRLGDWAFPTPNHVSTTTDADDDDDGNISASDMAHKSRDDEDNASQIGQTREECPEWIDDTDDHSCSPQTVPPQNARKRKSHAVIKRRATMSESSDEDEQSYVISKIFTQNAHGLR